MSLFEQGVERVSAGNRDALFFMEFHRAFEADTAMRELDGMELVGQALSASLANPAKPGAKRGGRSSIPLQQVRGALPFFFSYCFALPFRVSCRRQSEMKSCKTFVKMNWAKSSGRASERETEKMQKQRKR